MPHRRAPRVRRDWRRPAPRSARRSESARAACTSRKASITCCGGSTFAAALGDTHADLYSSASSGSVRARYSDCRTRTVRIGWICLRPITSRIALSATALIVNLRLLHVEQEIGRVPDYPRTQRTGRSTMFSSPVSMRLSAGTSRAVLPRADPQPRESDVRAIDARHLRRKRRLDRIRPVIVAARLGPIDELAEAQHDALLVRVHAVEPREQQHTISASTTSTAAAAAKAARQERAQPILATADQVLKIGRVRSARLRSRAHGPRGPPPPPPHCPPSGFFQGIQTSGARRLRFGLGYRGAGPAIQ